MYMPTSAFMNWGQPGMAPQISGNYSVPSYASGGGIDPNQNFMMPDVKVTDEGNGMTFGDKAGLAIGGLQTLGNLWMAFQANKLAKKQYGLTKRVTETNLANQIKSYNTQIADRGRSRAFTEGQSAEEAKAWASKNQLPDYKPIG